MSKFIKIVVRQGNQLKQFIINKDHIYVIKKYDEQNFSIRITLRDELLVCEMNYDKFLRDLNA